MNTAVAFHHVSKEYVLQDDRTLKEIVPRLLQGKPLVRKFQALSGVDFQIAQGETVGIVGKNGAGKSTVLKLIAGVSQPTHGSVEVNGRVAPVIELGAGFHHELSGIENIYLSAAILGMHRREIEQKIEEIIWFSELGEFVHVPVKRYSSGMQMRLAFSVAIHLGAPIILMDEVLAVGDQDFQQKCMKRLHELKDRHDTTIVFVSHDERAVLSFCDRALLLEHGKLVIDGKTRDVFTEYHQE